MLKRGLYPIVRSCLGLLNAWGVLSRIVTVEKSYMGRYVGASRRDGARMVVRLWGVEVGSVWLTHGTYYFEGANYAVVYSLFVHPAARGIGVGKRLVTECIKVSKDKGFDEVFLMCDKSNDVAVSLYVGLGFVDHMLSQYRSNYAKELTRSNTPNVIGFYFK